jgi:chaperonin GroES
MPTKEKNKKKAKIPKFEPIADRVVVRRDDAEEISPGGQIVIPDSAQEKSKIGTVIAVGPGPMLQDGSRGSMQVAEGDRVVISLYAEEAEIGGAAYVLLREGDIMSIIREE